MNMQGQRSEQLHVCTAKKRSYVSIGVRVSSECRIIHVQGMVKQRTPVTRVRMRKKRKPWSRIKVMSIIPVGGVWDSDTSRGVMW